MPETGEMPLILDGLMVNIIAKKKKNGKGKAGKVRLEVGKPGGNMRREALCKRRFSRL